MQKMKMFEPTVVQLRFKPNSTRFHNNPNQTNRRTVLFLVQLVELAVWSGFLNITIIMTSTDWHLNDKIMVCVSCRLVEILIGTSRSKRKNFLGIKRYPLEKIDYTFPQAYQQVDTLMSFRFSCQILLYYTN